MGHTKTTHTYSCLWRSFQRGPIASRGGSFSRGFAASVLASISSLANTDLLAASAARIYHSGRRCQDLAPQNMIMRAFAASRIEYGARQYTPDALIVVETPVYRKNTLSFRVLASVTFCFSSSQGHGHCAVENNLHFHPMFASDGKYMLRGQRLRKERTNALRQKKYMRRGGVRERIRVIWETT